MRHGSCICVRATILFFIVVWAPRLALGQAHRAKECDPPCQRDYLCLRGQCVSECNPPCEADEMCVNRDCVPVAAARPATPPPAQSIPPAPLPVRTPPSITSPAMSGQATLTKLPPLHAYTGMYLALGVDGALDIIMRGGNGIIAGGAIPNLRLGYAWADHWVLAGTLAWEFAPYAKYAESSHPPLRMRGLRTGAGLGYFGMPKDLYLFISGSYARMQIAFTNEGGTDQEVAFAKGVVLDASFGREFWFSDYLAAGLAAKLSWGLLNDVSGFKMNILAIGIALALTYN